MQVNVFELGHTYLQLVQTLNLRLPVVDPSHYIARFAALLEFGTETSRVAADAVRLVARFDRDWMTRGRRPAGVCGACLLLAARMNNFRRSVQEIVQVVKIADSTLKRRLDEFRQTPSSALTLADFRTVWLEEEVDPPAFTKGKEKEAKEAREREEVGIDVDGDDVEGENSGKSRKKGKRNKKKRPRDDDEDDEEMASIPSTPAPGCSRPAPVIDPQLLNESIFAGSITSADLPLFLPEQVGSGQATNTEAVLPQQCEGESALPGCLDISATQTEDDTGDTTLAKELEGFLGGEQGSVLTAAIDEAEERRRAQIALNEDEELLDLDEAELDAFILTEEEVTMKERVWVEINRDYLEALAAKQAAMDGAEPVKPRKVSAVTIFLNACLRSYNSPQRRKTTGSNKPRDASTPHGRTAAESVQNLIKKNAKYSKRINYDALRDLFGGDGRGEGQGDGSGADRSGGGDFQNNNLLVEPEISLDEKEDDLYQLDDKSDGEGMHIVEESGGGGVGQTPAEEIDFGNEDGEGEEYNWDDVYEQEV